MGTLGQIKCKVQRYTSEDGLSHDRISSIIEDEKGYLWAGTWDGINSFDGKTFISYKSLPGDQSPLKNDRIDKLVDDGEGNLWLRGYDNDVYYFDKKKERFFALDQLVPAIRYHSIKIKDIKCIDKGLVAVLTNNSGIYLITTQGAKPQIVNFKKGSGNGISLPSDTVNAVFQDDHKQIWIGTASGLIGIKASPNGHYKLIYKNQAISTLNYTDYAEDKQSIFIGTKQGNLLTLSKTHHTVKVIKVGSSPITAINRSGLHPVVYCATNAGQLAAVNINNANVFNHYQTGGTSILSVYEDHSGWLWLEPDTKGVIKLDPLTGRNKWYASRSDGISNGLHTYNVFEDNSGRVWVNMKGGGFGYYNAKADVIDADYVGASEDDPTRFPDLVYETYYDRFGIIWLSTKRGLLKVIPENLDFKEERVSPDTKSRLSNEVRGLFTDRQGRTWVGTKDAHLYVYRNYQKIPVRFEHLPPGGFGPVYTIVENYKGVVWIGTKKNGLFRAAPVAGWPNRFVISHYTTSAKLGSLSSNQVVSLFEDRNRRLWAGTFDNGILEITDVGGRVQFTPVTYSKKRNSDKFKKVRHITSDDKNNLWIATTDGLVVLDTHLNNGKAAKCAAFIKIPGVANSLADNDIQYILRDRHHKMWVATSGGGLGCATFTNPFKAVTFKNYTIQNGLPSDYIFSIKEDAAGYLWLATQNGISKFDPQEKTFRNYSSDDGFFGEQLSEASVTGTPNGDIIFGTIKGIVRFNPLKVAHAPISSDISFTGLKINNRPLPIGVAGSALKNSVDYTDTVILRYDQNFVTINFAVLDLKNGARQHLLHRLTGFEEAWQNNGKERSATYTNLSPGNYRFEIKLAGGRHTKDAVKQLTIIINPPFWKTWWAYIGYTFITTVLVILVINTIRTIIRLRQAVAIEKKVAALKTEFFTNISHELRTPLTLMINPIRELMKGSFPAKMQGYIQLLHRNTERLARFMDQWLELSKIQSGKSNLNLCKVELISFVEQVGSCFANAGSDKEVDLKVYSEHEKLFVTIDPDKIDSLLYNLLANAFKHAHAHTTVEVFIADDPSLGQYSISVRDQGTGVEPEHLETIFDLFYAGSNSNGSKQMKGVGIGLALAKQIAELHSGCINAKNNHLGGLDVVVRLPVSGPLSAVPVKEHLSKKDELFLTNKQVNAGEEAYAVQTISNEISADAPLILLVEDNTELREFLLQILREHYQVVSAVNGETGLQMALELMPDLILSDIMMPVMDGIEMLDKVKNNTLLSHIPVILLTAKTSVESQIEGLRYGADYYFSKPFHHDLLLAAISSIIHQRKIIFERFLNDKNPGRYAAEITLNPKDELFLNNVIRYVEEGMCEPDFNIEQVADKLAMGRTTFYKKFKSLSGITMVDLVRDKRLAKAKQLFDAGEDRVSTIAFQVGFSNPKYFSTCFKEKYAVTPTEYLNALHLQEKKA